MNNCFFCEYSKDVAYENEHSFAIFDEYPVSKGHMLVITKNHTNSLDSLTMSEIHDIIHLIKLCIKHLDNTYRPDGYNIGFNYREAAGQTIFHLHIHIIPRYMNDVPNPKGGIRNIFNNGDYSIHVRKNE